MRHFFHQFVLILSLVIVSWLGMQIIHELGHVLGAILTGAKISKIILHPLAISHTMLEANPSPLIVVSLGPVVGILGPLILLVLLHLIESRLEYLVRFFAGFCLVANGVYVGFGPGDSLADSGIMLANGVPRIVLIAFGVLATAAGFALWNGQSKHFGFQGHEINRKDPYLALVFLIAVVCLELVFSNR